MKMTIYQKTCKKFFEVLKRLRKLLGLNWMRKLKQLLFSLSENKARVPANSPVLQEQTQAFTQNFCAVLFEHLTLMNKLAKSETMFFFLRKLSSCKRNLNRKQRVLFVRCYVLSQIDYCNAVYKTNGSSIAKHSCRIIWQTAIAL